MCLPQGMIIVSRWSTNNATSIVGCLTYDTSVLLLRWSALIDRIVTTSSISSFKRNFIGFDF